MQHQWNYIIRGQLKYSEEYLHHCQFVHHKSLKDWQ